MKRAMTVFLMLVALALLNEAEASNQQDFAGISGSDRPLFSPGSDTKKIQDKISQALASLESNRDDKKTDLSEQLRIDAPLKGSNSSIAPANNSSLNDGLDGLSLNGSLDNSSLSGLSAANLGANTAANSSKPVQSDPNSIAGENESFSQNAGASGKGVFNGFYGMSATRHEIGKSGIDSSMFLSGNFEMEKNVRFQDQGVE